jgi:hypothetical protein
MRMRPRDAERGLQSEHEVLQPRSVHGGFPLPLHQRSIPPGPWGFEVCPLLGVSRRVAKSVPSLAQKGRQPVQVASGQV